MDSTIGIIVFIVIFVVPTVIRFFRTKSRNAKEPFKWNNNFSQAQNQISPELRDAYKTLNVSQDASDEEIKTVYRKLANLYHPDKNPNDEAKGKMLKINAAYALIKKERDL